MKSPGTDDRIKRDLHPDDAERVQTRAERRLISGVPFEGLKSGRLGKTDNFAGSYFGISLLR